MSFRLWLLNQPEKFLNQELLLRGASKPEQGLNFCSGQDDLALLQFSGQVSLPNLAQDRVSAQFCDGAPFEPPNTPLGNSQKQPHLPLGEEAGFVAKSVLVQMNDWLSRRAAHPGSLSTSLGFPFSGHQERLLAVRNAGAPPDLASLGAGKAGHPNPATSRTVDARFGDRDFSQRFIPQQCCDNFIGDAHHTLTTAHAAKSRCSQNPLGNQHQKSLIFRTFGLSFSRVQETVVM
jgi:hypothetical protein